MNIKKYIRVNKISTIRAKNNRSIKTKVQMKKIINNKPNNLIINTFNFELELNLLIY